MTRNKQPKLTLVIDPDKIKEIKQEAFNDDLTTSEYMVKLHDDNLRSKGKTPIVKEPTLPTEGE